MSPKVLILVVVLGAILFVGYARFNHGQTDISAEKR